MILKDSVEKTEEYRRVMEEIQPVLDKEFPKEDYRMGICHRIWMRKKRLLAQSGIDWKTPAEMNPDVIFD